MGPCLVSRMSQVDVKATTVNGEKNVSIVIPEIPFRWCHRKAKQIYVNLAFFPSLFWVFAPQPVCRMAPAVPLLFVLIKFLPIPEEKKFKTFSAPFTENVGQRKRGDTRVEELTSLKGRQWNGEMCHLTPSSTLQRHNKKWVKQCCSQLLNSTSQCPFLFEVRHSNCKTLFLPFGCMSPREAPVVDLLLAANITLRCLHHVSTFWFQRGVVKNLPHWLQLHSVNVMRAECWMRI